MRRDKKMPWVAFLGADGSGKSSIIEGVTEHLEAQGITVNYQHWRPVLRENIKGDAAPVTDPHGKPVRGVLASWMRIVTLAGLWWVSYFKYLVKLRKKGKFIIFDRFYEDLLVDPRRYRYGGGKVFAAFFFSFMPKPDLVMLLDADAEVLYARKPEVALERLRKIVTGYRSYIKTAKNGVLINSDQAVERVIAETIAKIDDLLEVNGKE